MKFSSSLLHGTLIKRYKRFLCDVTLDNGATVTASCPNTGSMMGLKEPGLGVWLSTSDNPKRKYPHTWEMVEVDLGHGPSLVGINTGHPNKLVAEAIENGTIVELQGYSQLKREQKYGKNSRIDILLSDESERKCYVEVKNVHLMREHGLAEFPDSVTERGTKHLGELADMVREGHRAMMMYLIQRGDAETFAFARDVDPVYGKAFDLASDVGVEALAYVCSMSPEGIEVMHNIPLEP